MFFPSIVIVYQNVTTVPILPHLTVPYNSYLMLRNTIIILQNLQQGRDIH